ncbi:hypothetical protein QBC45DRAFT_365509 [Copromyces sp. CBS 386.78]|nr:hypothetical protein QBC45DRAFT_365509 [Copromyces sp. CBS 386.78]
MVAVPGRRALFRPFPLHPGQLSSGSSLVQFWCSSSLVQSGAEVLQQRWEADRWDWTRSITREPHKARRWHSSTRGAKQQYPSIVPLTTFTRSSSPSQTHYDTVTQVQYLPDLARLIQAPRLHQSTLNPRPTIQMRNATLASQGYLTTGKKGTHPTEILSSVSELDSTERSPRS